MSNSYKKHPFQSICGGASAKDDKRRAHRGERHAHNQAIRRAAGEFDEFTLPHKLECSWNNNYSWSRDGSQQYMGLTARDWHSYLEALEPTASESEREHYGQWPPLWYRHMMRK